MDMCTVLSMSSLAHVSTAPPPHTTDTFEYGHSTLAWTPSTQSGNIGMISGRDAANVTAHGVTGAFSFEHDPTASFAAEGYTEFIELKYDTAIFPAAVRIGENHGMCAVVRILGRLSTMDSPYVELWRGNADVDCHRRYQFEERYRLFRADICRCAMHGSRDSCHAPPIFAQSVAWLTPRTHPLLGTAS